MEIPQLSPSEMKQLREASGYTQGELAQLLEVSRDTIGHWEAAQTKPYPWRYNKFFSICVKAIAAHFFSDVDRYRKIPNALVGFLAFQPAPAEVLLWYKDHNAVKRAVLTPSATKELKDYKWNKRSPKGIIRRLPLKVFDYILEAMKDNE